MFREPLLIGEWIADLCGDWLSFGNPDRRGLGRGCNCRSLRTRGRMRSQRRSFRVKEHAREECEVYGVCRDMQVEVDQTVQSDQKKADAG